MTVLDRTRLTGRLPHFTSAPHAKGRPAGGLRPCKLC